MIEYFLKFFPSYRHLLDTYADKIRLQDQVNQERGEKDWLREQLSQALASKDEFVKVERNALYQRAYGFKPHAEFAGIPDHIIQAAQDQQAGPVGGRPLAFEQVARENRLFREEYDARVRKALDANRKASEPSA